MSREACEHDPMAQRLREEAVEAAPAFSPALHDRVMHAVAANRVAPRRSAPILAWAAAAAIALVVAAVTWVGMRPERPGTRPTVPSLPGNPELTFVLPSDWVDGGASATSRELRRSLEGAQLAYLDRDARRFVDYLTEQVRVGGAWAEAGGAPGGVADDSPGGGVTRP